MTEYLIQWHGDSHLYDTWHTLREAHALCESGRGLKKLSNFIARERETAELMQAVSREEVEQMNVAAEMVRQEREEWVKVEKVIASREWPTALAKQTQRIRKRRRTFVIKEEDAEVPEAMAEEEKEDRTVVVKAEVHTDDMRMDVEEKTAITSTITTTESIVIKSETVIKPDPFSSSSSSSAEPFTTASLGSPAAMKDEDDEAHVVKMEDAQPADDEQPEREEDDEVEEDADSDDDEGQLYDDGTTVTQYLVKWRGLAHEDCTWECAEDISAYQTAIDDFLDLERLTSARAPSGGLSRKFRELTEQPAYLSQGELREYQVEGLNWLIHNWCAHINGILADEMGLGKTIQCIAFLSHLFHERHCHGPFLVVVPLSTITAWQREFAKWAPAMNVVLYVGNAKSREIIRAYEWLARGAQKGGAGGRGGGGAGKPRYRFHVVLTTYEFVTKEKGFLGSVHWNCCFIDEAHRLKDSRSLLYGVLHSFTTDYRLLITGTPLQNSLTELWCLLHFIEADKFPSLAEFEAQHANVRSGEMADLALLHGQLKPHLLRRTKKDVLKSLPSKREKILLVDMSALQRKYSRWIIARNYRDLNRGVGKGQKRTSLANIIMELKKCVNHPWLVKAPGDEDERDDSASAAADSAVPESVLKAMVRHSGKLILLDKLLTRLKETGHRVLIFSQMVKMLDILADYLRLRGFLFQRLDGGMRSQDRQYAMDHFNAPGSVDFCFILSTRAGGLGINLATADTVIIFDSDWNPQNDLQAEARAHRIGQKNTVNIYRFVTRNTVEEDILQRAKQKMILDHLVIQRMDTSGRTIIPSTQSGAGGGGGVLGSNSSALFDNRELAKILQFGAEDLFAESKEEEEKREKSMEEMDIDEILDRADENAVEGDSAGGDGEAKGEDQTEAFLSAFKVASFKSRENEEDAEEEAERRRKKEEEGQIEFWSRVIPASLIPAEQLQEEGAQPAVPLFLPPRQRKAVQSYNENKLREHRERAEGDDGEVDSDVSDDSDDEGRKGGGKRRKKDDGELSAKDVRQVYRHLMHFGDENRVVAELCAGVWKHRTQDDAFKERVRDVIRRIHQACEDELKNPRPPQDQDADDAKDKASKKPAGKKATAEDDGAADADGGKKKKKASTKPLSFEFLPGVTVHPAELLQRRRELQQLSLLISGYPDPLKFRITNTNKPVPDVRWSQCIWKAKQDAMLMLGVFLHGMNGWDAIVEDPKLRLKECIVIKRKKQISPPTTASPDAPSADGDRAEDSAGEKAAGGREEAKEQTEAVVTGGEGESAVVDSSAAVAASSSAAAPVVVIEETRTVKNTQLASRAALLLRLMLVDDSKAKKKKTKADAASTTKPSKASKPSADDAPKKRARVDPHPDSSDDASPPRDDADAPRKKRPKKDDDAANDDVDFEAPDDAAAPKRKKAKPAKDKAVTAAGEGGEGKAKAKKLDGVKRMDDSYKRTDHLETPTKTKSSPALSTAPLSADAAADSNGRAEERKGGKDKDKTPASKKKPLTSPPIVRESLKARSDSSKPFASPSASKRPLPAAASSAVSSTLGRAPGEDAEFIPELLTWCKAALSSHDAQLKAIHRFAHDVEGGGLKAHQAEVRPLLIAIGREVDRLVKAETKGAGIKAELERHLWHYVSLYTRMNGDKVHKLCAMLSKHQQPATAGPAASAAAAHKSGR